MISEDLKVHFTNKLNGDLIIANDINELKDKHNKGIDELVQLEQDVNLMRGDAQGVSFFNNTNNLYTTDVESFRNTTLHLVLSNLNAITSPEVIVTNTESSKGYRLSCTGTGNIQFFYCMGVFTFPSAKANTIDIVIDKNLNASLYNNAVLIGTKVFNIDSWVSRTFTIGALTSPGQEALKIGKINSIRKINTALTQQQIDTLYNQGRCDEVMLGDEWRGVANNVCTDIDFLANYQNTDFLKLSDTSFKLTAQQAGILIGAGSFSGGVNAFSNKLYKLSFIASEITNIKEMHTIYIGKTPIYLYKPVINGYNEYIITSGNVDSSGVWNIIRFQPTTTGQLSTITISNYKVEQLCLLNEYLPQYLTQTKWIDNGVNKQDIPLTAPTFSYVKPYKQYSSGSGTPTTLPEAAFIEYGDIDSGNIWKCKPKPNTRQFTTSDWKQITNV